MKLLIALVIIFMCSIPIPGIAQCIDDDHDNICDNIDTCVDVDGDGYGRGTGCIGTDCLDSDPNIPSKDADCDGNPDRLTNACGCENGTLITVSQGIGDKCRDKRINCIGGVKLELGYTCGPCFERFCTGPCNDEDPCTVNDFFDSNCKCIGQFEDSDRDGIGDGCDKCEGFDDNKDFDNDGLPNGCDPDPACADCQIDDDGNITLCLITTNGSARFFKGECKYLQYFFDEFGDFKSGRAYCGPCLCADLGKKDTDGDGVCDDVDECPDNPSFSKKHELCGCTDEDTDEDGVCNENDECPDNPAFSIAPECGCDEKSEACKIDVCEIGKKCKINILSGNFALDENDNCYCKLCPDKDRDGTCDQDDICDGYFDNMDSDKDGIPDDCDYDDCGCARNVQRVYVCQIRNGIEETKKVWCTDLYQTTYDQYCGPCSCADIGDRDSDHDGICDSFDQCPGYNDNNDRDGDGIPNLCDSDYPRCPDGCQIDENDKLLICHRTSARHAIQIKAECKYLEKYFIDIERGIFKDKDDHCGSCKCADFGKKDKDSDGICADEDCDDNDPNIGSENLDCPELSRLTISPNPIHSNQSFIIQMKPKELMDVNIQIVDGNGAMINSFIMKNGTHVVNSGNYEPGVYLVRTMMKSRIVLERLIVLN